MAHLPLADYLATLPHAVSWAAAYVTDPDGRVLLLRSVTCGERAWQLPGGQLDHDEIPHQAALRETLEETGIALAVTEPRLLAVEFGVPERGWPNRIGFVFDGGTITRRQCAAIRLSHEHDRWDLRTIEEWYELLSGAERERLSAVQRARCSGTTAYLHNGRADGGGEAAR
ncbi:NUDIX domain-containing protein [Streptomyces sp. URMC 123]|uniref:NUDIX domain-containing protein n=1 Tax=Streptomyces sp. URMC 123 TaxID=3423403 RepID=UPI003F1DE6B7